MSRASVAPASPAVRAAANPFAAVGLSVYLLFTASWFLHFGLRLPALGAVRFDLLLVGICLLLSLLSATGSTGTGRRWTSQHWIVLLLVYAAVTMPLVEWPGSVMNTGFQNFLKAAVFGLFTAAFVRTETGLRSFLLVFVGCQVIRVLEPVFLHVTTGYWGSFASMGGEFLDRLSGAPSDIVNPNGLAFVIVTSLLFCHFLLPLTRLGRVLYLAYLPLALWALTLTASRTGMVALAVVVILQWWKSPRKVLFLVTTAVIVVFAVPLLPDDLKDRYLSIVSSDTKNAETATGRSEGIRVGLQVAMRRPLFGHGLGTSTEAQANFARSDMPAHNLAVEVAQELGGFGVLLFGGFLFTLSTELAVVRRVHKARKEPSVVSRTAEAVHVFFWMNLVYSLASYGLSGYEWYLMSGLSSVLARLAEAAGDDAAPAPDRGAEAATRRRYAPAMAVIGHHGRR